LERNDSAKATTYRLDIEDLNENGDSLDEVLLDSLEVLHATNYLSYRYTWRNGDPNPKLVVIQGPYWVIVFGDTVMARIASFLFQDDLIADKYGVVKIYPEGSPPLLLTGMIINGVEYGNIVEVDESNESILSEYKLENNYPNPFNPTTKIKYTIPFVTLRQAQSDIRVTLKIYDILGREIATLVNEESDTGGAREYEVEFDGTNLPSGVYFYQLKVGSFVETKKMVLLK
jgi:hypothetical protein